MREKSSATQMVPPHASFFTLCLHVLGRGSHEDHATLLNFSNGFIYYFNFKEYSRRPKEMKKISWKMRKCTCALKLGWI